MRMAPLSADLVLKLSLLAGAGLVAWLLLERARAALPTLPDWQLPEVSWELANPASDKNLVYQATSGVVSAAVGHPETLGGWVYDLTHADPMAPKPASDTVDDPYDIPGMPNYFGA